MTGDRTAHPLLISLANIDMDTRMKGTNRALLLLALLPVSKFIHKNKRIRGVLQDRLSHECLDFVLAPLKIAASIGVMMSDPLGNLRYCFTPLAAYIVDTPEAQMLAGVGGKTSPATMAMYKQFGDPYRHEPRTASTSLAQLASLRERVDPANIEDYFLESKKVRLNGVDSPFWRDWALSDPSTFLTPEALHHWHRAFWDHDVKWCIRLMGGDELDFRFSVLQPRTGYRHFKEGISKLKQVTGRDHRDIQRYLIGIIADAVPKDFLIALRALMDFRYLAQSPVIDDTACKMIQASLKEFHDHKDIILDSGARVGKGNKPINNWHIPKVELLQSVVPLIYANGTPIQWSADATEHAHITEVKEPAKAGNNQNYDPQICRGLDRIDKCRRFDLATSVRDAHVVLGPPLDDDAMSNSDRDDDEDEGNRPQRHIHTTALLVSNIKPVSDILAGSRLLSNYFEEADSLNRGEYPKAPRPFRTFSAGSSAFHFTRDPSFKQMTVDNAATMFQLPDLRPALADYLQRAKGRHVPDLVIGGRRSAVAGCTLPFEKLQTWSRIRIQTKSFHLPHGITPPQTLNACPPSKEWPHGRYDKVLVNTDRQFLWPQSGLNGNVVIVLVVLKCLMSSLQDMWQSKFDSSCAQCCLKLPSPSKRSTRFLPTFNVLILFHSCLDRPQTGAALKLTLRLAWSS
jgi:hypothetical protein